MASRTVTFLFTDIEGSTRLWDESPETMRLALARHDALMRQAITTHGGEVFKTVGDAFCAAFDSAPAAAGAALAAQVALAAEGWATPRPIRVRMALHTGEAEVRDDDFFGPPLNRVARLLATGHGGQTLLSAATYELVRDALPLGASLAPLGGHRLKDLARPETVYGLLHPDLQKELPPLRSLDSDALPNNLPEQTTSFVGREDELRKVADELKRTRLLTLAGPGGSGKTRLALQAAAEAIDAFPGGAWLVELAPLGDPALVAPTVAGVLGVAEEAGKPLLTTLAERLRKAPTLLVLDNCEHLLDAAARLADALVRAVPTLRVLATSREPLGIAGEAVHRVPTLSLPPRTVSGREAAHTPESLSHFEAVRLFVERAVAQRMDFAVTNANAPALASLCLRLDGIPLAIELAAARVRALSVEGIEARLDDRFRLLTGGSRTALPRQQTLRALVEWSQGLLNDAERAAFRRLAAFSGGWTLEAAEAVVVGEGVEAWEVLDLLTSLVDKSLVTAEETDGVVRYGMLETIRQYAQERLGESGEEADAIARHAAFFEAFSVGRGMRCRENGAVMRETTREMDNLRAAIDRGKPLQGLVMAAGLFDFWGSVNAHREGYDRAVKAIAVEESPEDARVRYLAVLSAAIFAQGLSETQAAIDLSRQAVALARGIGDPDVLANALGWLAYCLRDTPDMRLVRSVFEESLTVKPTFPSAINLTELLVSMGEIEAADAALARAEALLETLPPGSTAYFRMFRHHVGCALRLAEGRLTEAWADLGKAIRLAEELHNEEILLDLRTQACSLSLAEGRFEEAYDAARGLVSDARQTRSRDNALVILARAAHALARTAEARPPLVEAIRKASPIDLVTAVETAAALSEADGRGVEAASLLGAAVGARRLLSVRVPPVSLPEREARLARLREALGDAAFDAAHAEGTAMDVEAARAYALAAFT